MTRNLEVLSDQELFNKTKRIAEFVRNARIKIMFGSAENWCKFMGKDNEDNKLLFSICLAAPIVHHIQKYTALLHELSHIVYQTPFSSIFKLIKNFTMPQVWFNVYNILEDQRIESHLTKEYIAYQRRFKRTLVGLGKEMKQEGFNSESPIDVLLAIRFFRDDLAIKSKHYEEYKKALENVSGTDKYGGLRILLTLKHLINEHIQNRIKNNKLKRDEKFCNAENGTVDTDKHWKKENKTHDKEQESYEKNLYRVQTDITHDEIKEEIRELNEKLGDVLDKAEEDGELSDGEKEQLVETSKRLGNIEYKQVHEKMLESGGEEDSLLLERVKYVERSMNPYNINYKLSKGLNRLFRTLKMTQKPFIDFEGHELNVNQYVENFIRGIDLNKSMNNKKITNGVSIIVSIDASSSMAGTRIDSVRDLVGTLYHSLKSIPNVEIRGNVWSSNHIGDIAITEINSVKDVKKISVNHKYNYTPTHMALEYSNKMLKEMKGKKKLLFIITDGIPNYRTNRSKLSVRNYRAVCRKSLGRTLKTTPNILFVVILERNIKLMQYFFDEKRIIPAQTIQTAIETVISNFRKAIMSVFV